MCYLIRLFIVVVVSRHFCQSLWLSLSLVVVFVSRRGRRLFQSLLSLLLLLSAIGFVLSEISSPDINWWATYMIEHVCSG